MKIQCYDHLPAAAAAIRYDVFMEEQGFQNEFDAIDDRARHLVLFIEDEAVGTCRFYEENGVIYIGRVCVRKNHRGKSFGSAMLSAVEKIVCAEGGGTTTLHAQVQAQPFYEKLGYTAYGAIDQEEGCPHIWMRKVIKGSHQ